MRAYQTLTLIGSIFGILIAFSVFVFLSAFDAGLSSLEQNYGNSDTPGNQIQRQTDLNQIGAGAGISILMMIVALVLVFALRSRTKVVGGYLIIVSFIVLIGIGLYGILPFALFLPAGIVALRYKPTRGSRYYEREDDEREDDERKMAKDKTICQKCEKPISPDAKFCSHCGNVLK